MQPCYDDDEHDNHLMMRKLCQLQCSFQPYLRYYLQKFECLHSHCLHMYSSNGNAPC